MRVSSCAGWVGFWPTAHRGEVFRPPCMHSRLRCMIRCVRASVNSVGLCRLAELYGRALVTIRVGGVALFFCYDCAGTVHIKRDSGRRDAALGGWLQRGEAARGSMALHCACGFIARCVAWESHARGSDCSRPQAKRVAHTHTYTARAFFAVAVAPLKRWHRHPRVLCAGQGACRNGQ